MRLGLGGAEQSQVARPQETELLCSREDTQLESRRARLSCCTKEARLAWKRVGRVRDEAGGTGRATTESVRSSCEEHPSPSHEEEDGSSDSHTSRHDTLETLPVLQVIAPLRTLFLNGWLRPH